MNSFQWWTGDSAILEKFLSSHLQGGKWNSNAVWTATKDRELVCALPIFDSGHTVVYAWGLEVASSVMGQLIVYEFFQSLCQELKRCGKQHIIFETTSAQLAVFLERRLKTIPMGVSWGMAKTIV